MDVRSCGMQGPLAERHTCANSDPDLTQRAFSPARPGISRFFLDFDLHGGRSSRGNEPG
jgi:hypothetical protein